jgi:polysaccharide biosynthesis/export protein
MKVKKFIVSSRQDAGLHVFSVLLIAILSTLSSCTTTRNTTYFQDIPDSTLYRKVPTAAFAEPIIQSDDILSINIQTIEPEAGSNIGRGNLSSAIAASSASSIGNQAISGFLVDKNGFVELPLLGKVRLGGLTTFQAREQIRSIAEKEFKSPAVQVRFANYKITVIGEVARPATYTIPNEKVSILDALGLAGDLTIYGRRDNILLIRDHGDKKEMVRLNIGSTDLLKSPYYYLKQNDVIYIEPNKAKVATNNAARTQIIAISTSVISLMVVVISRLF